MATQGRRRAYGQHFLRDTHVCETIAEETCALLVKTGADSLLEIGPGQGAITLPLYRRLREEPGSIREFRLVEKDRVLVAQWENKVVNELPSFPVPFPVVSADFLELPEEKWLAHPRVGVVSNLPYSSGTAIFQRLAQLPSRIPFMVLMFQAEVAHRLRAEYNTKSWGSLSVWTQNLWEVSPFLKVPPGAFQPPPQVNSEVIILLPRAEPLVPMTQAEQPLWQNLLKACFQHRRKMLRSGLPPDGPWRNALARSGLDGTKRSESLNWDEWRQLWSAVREVSAQSQATRG